MSLLPFEKIKRKELVRKSAETSAKFGCRPEDRTTEQILNYGVVNIDKPSGPTSHQVSDYLQRVLNINKSGHSGTLDPKVTGCLPVALGDSTKVVQVLLHAGKEYVGIMHLHKTVSEKKLNEAIEKFTGRIKQLPPIKSSVKRQWRFRNIYYFEVLEISEDGKDILFKVGCQAGTYIRKLVHDLGQGIKDETGNPIGAHMSELRRTKAGPFNESTLCTLQDLADAFYYYKQGNNESRNDKFLRAIIQPVENAVAHLPKVWVFDTTVDTLCHGAQLKVPGISKVESDIQTADQVAIMTLKDELVAFGEALIISKSMVQEERGIAVKIKRVFMKPGVYPRIDRLPNV
ncbi:RNA-guided pseudouridylation complex pseudouridine synthase subunit Cbf5 [Candidatus Woesearchaeota archaeon]|nr:RNA-guided pseudouridylation complex pseudouridine synthase subunit Cbf5 [Candidatus Woesearchaeota archaeon]